MDLSSYFDFLAPNDIRIKGHRIGIESILYEYIHNERSAEQINQEFPTLTLEQIYATILYYLHSKDRIDQYLTEWLEFGERMRAEQAKNPTPFMLKVRKLRAERRVHQAAERVNAIA
jgi:uncharacterized protein (DUF433 family)